MSKAVQGKQAGQEVEVVGDWALLNWNSIQIVAVAMVMMKTLLAG